jgi:hypothetical protein
MTRLFRFGGRWFVEKDQDYGPVYEIDESEIDFDDVPLDTDSYLFQADPRAWQQLIEYDTGFQGVHVPHQCQGYIKDGHRCNRKVGKESKCWQHNMHQDDYGSPRDFLDLISKNENVRVNVEPKNSGRNSRNSRNSRIKQKNRRKRKTELQRFRSNKRSGRKSDGFNNPEGLFDF